MKSLIAALCRRVADRLEPQEYEEEADIVPHPVQFVIEMPHGGRQVSEPIDFQALWRDQAADHGMYIEENDVYSHSGTYL